MKNKTILILILGVYVNIHVFGQCITDNLFPLDIGVSKFQAINTLNLKNNIFEVKDFLNYWSHPDYLNGDSVYSSQVNFKYKTHDCLKSTDNDVLLSFTDKKLYRMTLKIYFKPENYDKCLENYNQILASLKKEYPVYDGFYSYNDTITKEQTGEGYWLYKNEEEKHADKFEQISISYTMEYEEKWSSYSKEYYKTGKIDQYVIKVSFVNCKGTKLDKRGY